MAGPSIVWALALLVGVEAYSVLRDICRLTPDGALSVSRWTAATLVQAVLEDRAAPIEQPLAPPEDG